MFAYLGDMAVHSESVCSNKVALANFGQHNTGLIPKILCYPSETAEDLE